MRKSKLNERIPECRREIRPLQMLRILAEILKGMSDAPHYNLKALTSNYQMNGQTVRSAKGVRNAFAALRNDGLEGARKPTATNPHYLE